MVAMTVVMMMLVIMILMWWYVRVMNVDRDRGAHGGRGHDGGDRDRGHRAHVYGHILRNILLRRVLAFPMNFLFRCVRTIQRPVLYRSHMNRTCVRSWISCKALMLRTR